MIFFFLLALLIFVLLMSSGDSGHDNAAKSSTVSQRVDSVDDEQKVIDEIRQCDCDKQQDAKSPLSSLTERERADTSSPVVEIFADSHTSPIESKKVDEKVDEIEESKLLSLSSIVAKELSSAFETTPLSAMNTKESNDPYDEEKLIRLIDERIRVHLTNFVERTRTRRVVRLNVGTLNCSGNLVNGQVNWILDNRNTQLYGISHLDFCALQELVVPNSRWDKPRPGIIERFSCVKRQRAHNLILSSVTEIDNSQKAFGLYVNPNLNFRHTSMTGEALKESDSPPLHWNSDVATHRVLAKNNKGALLVRGILYDSFDAIIGSIHGLYEGNKPKLAYDNPINRKIVTDVVKYVCGLKKLPDVFILIGDFNLRSSCFQRYLNDEWKLLWNSLQSEIDFCVHDDGLVTCFDKDGFAQPDHILTNQTICDFSVANCYETDHMYMSVQLELNLSKTTSGSVANTASSSSPPRQNVDEDNSDCKKLLGGNYDDECNEIYRVKRFRAINVNLSDLR